MIGALNDDLASEQQKATRMERLRMAIIIATTALNLSFLGWSFGRLKREIAAREASNLEVYRQKDLLAVTLASIGDAVIVTDTLGQVTFMNRVAEELTGWPIADAAGMPLAEVFKIVNESTRAPVESPVDKVLRLGVIVGLANHTLLLRRDGPEVPIDDSGAPIREPDGTLRGVVLIFRDFSDHKDAEKRLRQAKAEVEAASRAKDHFLATLSHELRTPLTPILATLDSWEAVGEVPPALAGDVQIIRRNIGLEARLIDDLLDLTRIVRGKLPLNLDEVDVHELLEAVTAMCRGDAEARRIELSLRLSAQRHHARADPARLQQVFWNVLKNAIKFTPEQGRIQVASNNEAHSGICVTFADDGIGMSEQTIARVFRPFEQATEETARQYGGLGLGLAISRGLIEAQGGSISATSPGPGKGSTISVRLSNIDATKVTEPVTRPGAAASVASTRALSILLVEDHPDTAHVMSRLLRRLGHTVQTSGTVAEAAELARNSPYDLLLSDIGLPDGTGIDLIRQVRAHRALTAIALTGYGMEDDIARCLEAGFTAHLTKPIDFQHLERMVQQVADGEANGKGGE
jgi:PAS domain S-box-containing protein